MQDESQQDQALPSKSQLKRDARDLKQLGADLLEVPESDWHALRLPERLIEALRETRRTPGRGGARKRQLQYLGKLMRELDAEPIREYFLQRRLQAQRGIDAHHQLEQWRDRIIEQGDSAIEEFLGQHPAADRQHLRQLARHAKKERDANKPAKSSRALFRYLRDLDDSGPEESTG